jgi:excisionase family DNA binding protein
MTTDVGSLLEESYDSCSAHRDACVLCEILTAQQIASLLQMPVSTVEDYARRRVLPSIKLGRRRRFIRSEVEAAIADLSLARPRDRHYPVMRRGPRR